VLLVLVMAKQQDDNFKLLCCAHDTKIKKRVLDGEIMIIDATFVRKKKLMALYNF